MRAKALLSTAADSPPPPPPQWQRQREAIRRHLDSLWDSPGTKAGEASASGGAREKYEAAASGGAREKYSAASGGAREKYGKFRRDVNRWWNEQLRESDKVFAVIFGLNAIVLAAWKLPKMQPLMLRYFASRAPAAAAAAAVASPPAAVCLPMVLSVFSHYSFFHFAANMYVLHSFAAPVVHDLGKEQFVCVYLCSGVWSSLSSVLYKAVLGHGGAGTGLSLGASGAICAVLGLFGTLNPDARMQIILLPVITFTAGTAIKGLMAIDSLGLVLGWKFFDHAAHLGGVLFGIGWCTHGHQLLWHRRDIIMSWWHENVRGREKPPPPPPDRA